MWLPIDHYIYLVGRRGNFKSSVAEVILSFFGPWNKHHALVGWDSTASSLNVFAQAAKNMVFCVDDFVYPKDSRRKHDFTVKADAFLRSVANGSSKGRAKDQGNSVEEAGRLNCLALATGELPPRDVNESLHERGIYISIDTGDIDIDSLSLIQVQASNGVYARVIVAFIQRLLSDYDENEKRAEKWFEKARNTARCSGLQIYPTKTCKQSNIQPELFANIRHLWP